MSEVNNLDPEVEAAELEALKERADTLGVKYHPSIGYEKLYEKVAQATKKEPESDTAAMTPPTNVHSLKDRLNQQRLAMKLEQTALVRVEVTCMNPNKRQWPGELFCVSNRIVGDIEKYVPYNVPFHVPRMILTMIQERRCQIFVDSRNSDGRKEHKGKLIAEFGIRILPSLGPDELKSLAQRQAMANGTAGA
jgi:hypothetical protein